MGVTGAGKSTSISLLSGEDIEIGRGQTSCKSFCRVNGKTNYDLGSLLCALASTLHMFVIGRAVTGVATAGVISGFFTLVCRTLCHGHITDLV